MNNRKVAFNSIYLSLILSCGAIGHAAFNNDMPEASVDEANAWKVVQKSAETDSDAENTLKFLSWYLKLYPRGMHESDARFATAELLFKTGRFDQALPYYQGILQRRDASYFNDSLLRTGEIHYNTGKFAKAEEIWQVLSKRVSGDSPLQAEAMYGIALCEMKNSDYALASKLLQKLTHKFSGYQNLDKIREAFGIMHYQERQYRESVETLEGINTPTANFYRGLSHFHQQQYLEAADAFQKMEGTGAGYFGELASYLKADCFRLANNDALAMRAFDQFITAFPDSRLKATALTYLAGSQMRLGNYDAAMNSVNLVRKMSVPAYVRAYALHQGAEVAMHLKDYKSAIEMLNGVSSSVSKEDPNLYASVQVAKGYALLLDGQQPAAERTLQNYVHTMPYTQLSAPAYMVLGEIAYQNKEWDAAVSAYQSALMQYKYSPISDVAMTMMLASFFQENRFQDLVTNSNRVMKVVDSDFSTQNFLWRAYGHMILAESYYKLKLYADASNHYEQAMKHPSLAPWARFYLAWSRYHEEKYADAVHLGGKVLENSQFPEQNRASAELLIAASYFNQKDYDSAIGTLQDFRKRFPDDDHVPETWLQEGWAHLQAGYPADALNSWKKLIAAFPDHPLAQEAQLLVGRIYFQARQYQLATGALSKFLKQWPRAASVADARWMLAQSYYNNRQDDEAIEAYQTFISKFPNDHRVADGKTQLQLTQYRQANESKSPKLLTQFVATYPKSELASEAQFQLAQILHERKDYPNALQEYRKLMLDYPGSSNAPIALLATGHIEDHLNQPLAALKEYESLLKLFPTSSVAIDAAMRQGAIYFAMNKYADAARSFNFAVEREAPKDIKISALYNLSVSNKKDRNYPEALKHFGEFIDQYPDDPKVTDALLETAALHTAMDNPLKAAETYQRVLLRPGTPVAMQIDINRQVGEIYQKLGNREKAIESYSRLLALAPKKEEARLLGLAQLAALYEEKGDWNNALTVYDAIHSSGGRKDWIIAATKRMKQIKAQLEMQAKQKSAAGAQTTAVDAPANTPNSDVIPNQVGSETSRPRPGKKSSKKTAAAKESTKVEMKDEDTDP